MSSKFPTTPLKRNRVLDVDSYKLSHSAAYPPEISGMFSYIEARADKNTTIIPFGLQMWVIKTLLEPFTKEEVDEAVEFAAAHGEPFDRGPWDYMLERYNGYFPVTIRGIPEGTRATAGVPLVTIECTDKRVFWLSSYLETSLQRGVWYPTTIASNDYKNWRIIKRYLAETSDRPSEALPFMLHDFGARGVSSEETAQVGGAAHLLFFSGSDTISGVRAANWYYSEPMAAYSVPASEHSVQCAYGPAGQARYLEAMLSEYAKSGKIVSIVLDGYDVYRESELLCTTYKQAIIGSGARVMFRPDSGNPMEVVRRILSLQATTFGYKVNSKGYKVINNVGVVQGDGVSTETIEQLLDLVTGLGYSAENIVFGSGGALLQKVNRDTYKFAQKASAVLVGGKWRGVFKDPVTDPGKSSKQGRVTAIRWNLTGEVAYADLDILQTNEATDLMVTIYDCGKLVNPTTLAEVRQRATVGG